MEKYKKKKFSKPKKFILGPCKNKSKKNYCDGKFNLPKCPIKYAFFGIVTSLKGWKEYEIGDTCKIGKYTCPEYVEWAIPWKGKTEYIGFVDGGQLKGFKPSNKGPCLFMTIISTNSDLLKTINELFEFVPKSEAEMTKYLKTNLMAPVDIRKKAIKIASNYNPPRIRS